MKRSRRRGRGACASLSSVTSLGVRGLGSLLALGVGLSAPACGLDERGALPPGSGTTSSSSSSSSGAGGDGGATSSSSSSTGPGGMGGAGGIGGAGGMGGMGGVGGAGGMGGMGGAGGAGGAGGGPVVAIREWTANVPGVGTPPIYTFPDGWLEIQCPTDQRTSQFSSSTVRMGYGANAARPRNVNGKWGLSVESARKNKIKNSLSWTGAAWFTFAAAMQSVPMQSDPSGGMNATKFVSMGNQQSPYYTSGVPAGYASSWLKGEGATSPYSYFVLETSPSNWTATPVDDAMNWKRYELGVSSGYFLLETRGDGDGDPVVINYPSATHVFGAQHETLSDNKIVKYPSSYIPTQDVERIREADRLFTNFNGELIQPGGYINVVIKFAPNYAYGEQLGDHSILFIDAANQIYLDTSAGQFVLKTNNQKLAGPGAGMLSWSREQELTITVKTSPSGREFSLSGATTGNFSKLTDALDAPVVTNKPIYILGNDTTTQEGADLRYIGFFK